MSRKPVLYKSLVIGVILLFIGVSIAPSLYANEIKDEGLIEYTTTVCGIGEGKRTVYLTQEESQEVELFLDSIQEQLEFTKSIEEAKEIFKEAVIELDKYGLLAGLSIEDAQKLVTRDLPLNTRQRISDKGEKFFDNIFCMLSATAEPADNEMSFLIPGGPLLLFVGALAVLIEELGFSNLGIAIFILTCFLSAFNPIRLFNIILSILYRWEGMSVGLRGNVVINRDCMIVGFTGLMILKDSFWGTGAHFLGCCFGIIISGY